MAIFQHKNCIILAAFLVQSCRTHYYFPAYETGLNSFPIEIDTEQPLKGAKIDVSCTTQLSSGKRIPEPDLCVKLESWLNQSGIDQTEYEKSDLIVNISLSSHERKPSSFDSAFNIFSLGFYPTQTDHWYQAGIQIYDSKNNLINNGEFKAMFRTYLSWAYFFYARLLAKLNNQTPHFSQVENSQDFYSYFGQIVSEARRIQLAAEPRDPEVMPP